MKITEVALYRTDLPYVGGAYGWGAGNAIESAVATVVIVATDAGLRGCGEFTPCGESYMAAHSEGVAAAARLLAPALLGEDPRQVGRIEHIMDATLQGHGYAKAPFDAACWDLLGQACQQPVWMLLGGRLTHGAPMYRVAPQRPLLETLAEIDAHRESGYRQFQLKVGSDWAADIERIRGVVPFLQPGERVFVDANRGWRVDEAIAVVRATADLDYVIEQPCHTYEECLQVRRVCELPMKLDECITDMSMALRVIEDRSAEIVCLKLSNLGGLSKARRVRDLLVGHGIPVIAEDTWGAEIASSTVAHFAASTPEHALVASTDLHHYVAGSTGRPGPPVHHGRLFTPDGPGLGVEPDLDALGDPVAVFE